MEEEYSSISGGHCWTWNYSCISLAQSFLDSWQQVLSVTGREEAQPTRICFSFFFNCLFSISETYSGSIDSTEAYFSLLNLCLNTMTKISFPRFVIEYASLRERHWHRFDIDGKYSSASSSSSTTTMKGARAAHTTFDISIDCWLGRPSLAWFNQHWSNNGEFFHGCFNAG